MGIHSMKNVHTNECIWYLAGVTSIELIACVWMCIQIFSLRLTPIEISVLIVLSLKVKPKNDSTGEEAKEQRKIFAFKSHKHR